MSIKRGDVVTHAIAEQWGVGKVVEASPEKVSILFNDGITRKIVCSHFESLLPAAQSSYVPVPEEAPKAAPRKAAKSAPRAPKRAKP